MMKTFLGLAIYVTNNCLIVQKYWTIQTSLGVDRLGVPNLHDPYNIQYYCTL